MRDAVDYHSVLSLALASLNNTRTKLSFLFFETLPHYLFTVRQLLLIDSYERFDDGIRLRIEFQDFLLQAIIDFRCDWPRVHRSRSLFIFVFD